MHQFSSSMKKQIAIFILVNILLQSCVVYQNTSVPINQAVDLGKAKLITTTGNELLIKNIEKVDSTYYGDLGTYTISIPPGEVEAIYLYDKKITNKRQLIGLGVGVVVFTGTFLLAGLGSW